MYHICVDGLCIRLASGVVFVCNNRGLDPNYLHINIIHPNKKLHITRDFSHNMGQTIEVTLRTV